MPVYMSIEAIDKFQFWLNSPEYRMIAPLREQSAKVNAIVVEGI